MIIWQFQINHHRNKKNTQYTTQSDEYVKANTQHTKIQTETNVKKNTRTKQQIHTYKENIVKIQKLIESFAFEISNQHTILHETTDHTLYSAEQKS